MKRRIINVTSKEGKSTVSCANNQQCLFNHSVIAHTVAELLLCQKSPVESTKQENDTMEENLNIRELKGIDIAARYTLKQENGLWFVPSASGKSTRYKVHLKSQKCSCPDFEIRRQKCKHLYAVEFHFEHNFLRE